MKITFANGVIIAANRCGYCSRPLTDAGSVADGMGPVCRVNHAHGKAPRRAAHGVAGTRSVVTDDMIRAMIDRAMAAAGATI